MRQHMKSHTSLLLLGITGALTAGAAWVLFKPSANVMRPQVKEARTQATVSMQPKTAAPPPAELSMLSEPPPAKPKKGKPPAQDPAARAALSLVGKDAAAELVWMEAINNASLPKQERQDLIEDLNEDGMSNKKRPTRADLPLIEARLKIIERIMPSAMDQTNLDAFAEARKDLMQMQADLSR